MPDITLPTDAIPDCGGEQYVPQWRDDMLYDVVEEETVCAVQFPADASYISVGPYYPGGIYPVPQTEAERLESAKGALILGTVASADTCDIGSDWVLSFLDDILSAVGGTDYAYYPGAQPMLYFEDAAATIPATLNGVVGAMASADGAIIAVQATTGNKPFLRRTPTTGIYWLDSNTSTGALVATFGSSLGSACTVVRAGLYGVTFEEGVTIGTTYNIAPPFGFNSELMLINRPLTTAEKALLTQYMGRSVPTLSAEIVINGEFTADISGWTPPGGNVTLSWDSGVLVANRQSVSSNTYATQIPGYTHDPGNQYVARAKNAGVGSANNVIMYSGASASNLVHPAMSSLIAGEERTVVGQSDVASGELTVRLGTNSATTGERRYDNISLRRIL